MYKNFASIYDELMEDVDYKSWSIYIQKIIDKFNIQGMDILEMACGTGNISYYLAKANYNITCFDFSSDMLVQAYNKLMNFNNVKIIHQNMISFKSPEKYDVILSLCDSINYILDSSDLEKTFINVYNHLKPGGIFIFDINSYYKLKHIIGNNTFVDEKNNIFYTWRNYFDEDKDICEFYIDFFVKDKFNKYSRFKEEHYERAYKIEEVTSLLYKLNFKELHIYDDLTFSKPTSKSERINFVALK